MQPFIKMKNRFIALTISLLACSASFAQGIINSEMTTMELFLRENVLHEDVEMVARFVPGPENGKASYYADKYQGLKTASGERFDTAAMTCAHRNYAFGSMLKVTRLDNQKSVIVRVNDRGPFVAERIIDLSKKPARQLGLLRAGMAEVLVEPLPDNVPPTTTVTPPITTTNPVTPPLSSTNPITEVPALGKGFFAIADDKPTSEGFGVQTGSYTDAKTLFFHIDNLKQKGISPLMIHSGIANNQPIFRLIVGPFKSKKDTNKAMSALQKEGLAGFVVDMKGMK